MGTFTLNSVLQQALQLGVLIGAVHSVNSTLARRHPKLAYVLWMLVFAKAVTPSIGATEFSVWNLFATTADSSGDRSVTHAEGGFQPTMAPAAAADARDLRASDFDRSGRNSWLSESRAFWLAVAWSIGVMALVFLIARASRRMSRRVTASMVEPPHDLSRLVGDLGASISLARIPTCVVLDAPIGPALRGFMSPQILIPKRIVESCRREELQLILLHELMHARRRDVLSAYFQTIVQVLWWFHPAVWLAGRMANFERERCCDDAVLNVTPSARSVYAQCLLAVAQTRDHHPRMPAMVGMSGFKALRRRMRYIMDPARPPTPNWVVTLQAAVFAITVFPGAIPIAATVDATSGRSSASSPATSEEPSTGRPKLIALSWVESPDRNETRGGGVMWQADGTQLTNSEMQRLRRNAGSTEVTGWKAHLETRPLAFVFESGANLPIGTPIRTACLLPSGRIANSGSFLGLHAGHQDPDRRFARSANTISFRRGQKMEWPERIDVEVKYPVGELTFVKQPPKPPVVPLEITRNITWSAELVQHPTQKNPDGTPRRVLAGVVRKLRQPGDSLVNHSIRVFMKSSDEPLGTIKVELQSINGEPYQVDTSEPIASIEEIDRIEVTRQQFARFVLKDVRVRRDLMPHP